MTRMICLRASSDCKRLTKHENTGLGWVIAASRSVCDTPFHSLILYVVSRRLPPADVSTRRCRQSTQKKMTWRRQKYLLVLAESPGLRRALPSSAHRTDIVPQIKTHAATFKDFSG